MFTTIFLLVVCLLLLGYAVLLLTYRKWFLQLKIFVKPIAYKPQISFSIIIPARNESLNIGSCLLGIVQQNFPAELFEIIVVDDHSTDDTCLIVEKFQKQYNNIRLLKLQDELDGEILNSYKKKAIEKAVEVSTKEWIITTDADCIVLNNWLSTYSAFIQQSHAFFVAAPVVYTNNGSVLQTFQLIDFMSMQGVTAASVTSGFHSMCNGANLAYKKSVFYEVNGFKGIDEIASGDDMLLMNKIKKMYPENVAYLFSKDAIVATHPMLSWKSFFNQRIRWASKADKFQTKDNKVFAVLVLIYLLNVCLFFMPFFTIFNWHFLLYWTVIIGIKTLIELSFAMPVANFFGVPFASWFILLQPVHIAYIVISGWLGKFGSYHWKERKVK